MIFYSLIFFLNVSAWQLPIVIIEEIKITGNTSTRDAEILRITGLRLGQQIMPEVLDRAKNDLLSASIFESAAVTATKGSTSENVKIAIEVKEKLTWFIVPNLSYSSSGFGGGAAYGESNLFGMAKKILAAGYASSKNRTAILGYRDPSIAGSSAILAVDGIFRWDTMIEYDDGNESRRVRVIEYGVTLLPGVQWSQHFSTSIGVFLRKVKQNQLGTPTSSRILDPYSLNDGNDISAIAQFNYQDSTSIDGLFKGFEMGLESQISDNRFFSDFEYFRQIIRLKYGLVFLNDKLSYINQVSGQFGRTLPYYRELMVGGDNLRGYKSREFRGDTRYSLNQELMVPLYSFKRAITRVAFFWDSSAMYFKDRKFNRDVWRNGVGVGGRLYFKGIAVPLIGYDLGYGLEQKTLEHYINVGVSF